VVVTITKIIIGEKGCKQGQVIVDNFIQEG